MLIRIACENDIKDWNGFNSKIDYGCDTFDFGSHDFYYQFKDHLDRNEIIVANNRMSNELTGIICYSKEENSILFLSVNMRHREKGIEQKLLLCAIRQLDFSRDISVIVNCNDSSNFDNVIKFYSKFEFIVKERKTNSDGNISQLVKRATNGNKGKSFHYDYDRYEELSKIENCPPCTHEFMVLEGSKRIADFEYSYVDVCRIADGSLFGKCSIIPKTHVIHFEDMSNADMIGFMSDLQKLGKALKKITGAVKINYEMHSNTLPHLHVHVFPRYLDDEFASLPIDFRVKDPNPYESDEEFEWFIDNMRNELGMKHLK